MAGLFVFVFALYLAAALLAKKVPGDGERHVTIAAFVLLISVSLSQRLPLGIVSLLSLFVAAYLRRAH